MKTDYEDGPWRQAMKTDYEDRPWRQAMKTDHEDRPWRQGGHEKADIILSKIINYYLYEIQEVTADCSNYYVW